MRIFLQTFLLMVIQAISFHAVGQMPDPLYLNQIVPDTTPRVFAPGTVSTPMEFEFGAIFSDDQREFYYGVYTGGKSETRVTKFENGSWTTPVKLLVHDVYSFNDPFLSPDSRKLFFISDRPLNGVGPVKDFDIWYVERTRTGWSEPINAGVSINSDRNEYYMSFTREGKMYYSSNREDTHDQNDYDIYTSELKKGVFQRSIKLSTSINSTSYEADVYVAPDESYVVFASDRPDGLGSGDLYVSFRRKDGTWTAAKSLGNTVNTDTDDFCPFVSHDGKYLFYASRGDVYWVSTEVITRLRNK